MSKLPKEDLNQRVENLFQQIKDQHKSEKYKIVTQFQNEGIIINDPQEFQKGWICSEFIRILRGGTFEVFDLTQKEKDEIELKYIKKIVAEFTNK